MTSIGNGICGWVTSLTASVALALVLLFGGALPASSAPGQCPTLGSNEIDDEFTIWSESVGFDPLTDTISCEDDPTLPEIGLGFSRQLPDGRHSSFLVAVIENSSEPMSGGREGISVVKTLVAISSSMADKGRETAV